MSGVKTNTVGGIVMKGTFVAVMACSVAFSFAGNCNFDKSMRNFEKRMGYSMNGAKVTKNIASEDDGVSVIQKLSKPMKSGQYMGLRQFAVFGFIGCELKDVRTGKVSKDGDVVAEATVHLRPDGNLKASCKGNGDVMRANPFTYSMEPNPDCICYDENSLERKPGRKTGCAEMEDFDGDRLVIPTKALGSSVKIVEKDCYFDAADVGGRTAKKVLTVVNKNLKKLATAVDSVDGDEKDGKVTLKLNISADGSVTYARVVSATLFNNDVKNVVSETVSGWNFGKAKANDVVFFLVLDVAK